MRMALERKAESQSGRQKANQICEKYFQEMDFSSGSEGWEESSEFSPCSFGAETVAAGFEDFFFFDFGGFFL